ncbi:hypothetical protein K2W90_02935 [Candidatus Babeliales bacterium]|nr:hypothetical protein [Candidatus Babeliales bacterium]
MKNRLGMVSRIVVFVGGVWWLPFLQPLTQACDSELTTAVEDIGQAFEEDFLGALSQDDSIKKIKKMIPQNNQQSNGDQVLRLTINDLLRSQRSILEKLDHEKKSGEEKVGFRIKRKFSGVVIIVCLILSIYVIWKVDFLQKLRSWLPAWGNHENDSGENNQDKESECCDSSRTKAPNYNISADDLHGESQYCPGHVLKGSGARHASSRGNLYEEAQPSAGNALENEKDADIFGKDVPINSQRSRPRSNNGIGRGGRTRFSSKNTSSNNLNEEFLFSSGNGVESWEDGDIFGKDVPLDSQKSQSRSNNGTGSDEKARVSGKNTSNNNLDEEFLFSSGNGVEILEAADIFGKDVSLNSQKSQSCSGNAWKNSEVACGSIQGDLHEVDQSPVDIFSKIRLRKNIDLVLVKSLQERLDYACNIGLLELSQMALAEYPNE